VDFSWFYLIYFLPRRSLSRAWTVHGLLWIFADGYNQGNSSTRPKD